MSEFSSKNRCICTYLLGGLRWLGDQMIRNIKRELLVRKKKQTIERDERKYPFSSCRSHLLSDLSRFTAWKNKKKRKEKKRKEKKRKETFS